MNPIKTEIQLTADGSATLYRSDIDEHYHSVKGAVTESRHVYVDCGLRKRSEYFTYDLLRVLEVGFGTGLNVALSVNAVDKPVHYISLELYPLGRPVVDAMGYDKVVPVIVDVNDAVWDTPVQITPEFVLEKRHVDFFGYQLPRDIDVVYYDAFAPDKQPQMWSGLCFRRVFEVMRPGGILTTYCAKGSVRRMLEAVGFVVERLAGPEGGKREILRAIKPV